MALIHKGTHVYVVSLVFEYESSTPVRVCARKKWADAYLKKLRDYEDKRPQTPRSYYPLTPEQEEDWKVYERARIKWQRQHPTPQHTYGNTWKIERVRFDGGD
jgi:hypothetical protein